MHIPRQFLNHPIPELLLLESVKKLLGNRIKMEVSGTQQSICYGSPACSSRRRMEEASGVFL
jgi:hypothetical protein